ncbi:hypothetical protein KVV02_004039 [Mortierella alpina]|uniref:Uncharacterized protein n=1 Tax=Mortierella alpina TaxID=64518 RepID=A0A9P8D049_MORAP|nr:hypothetical protein KVV02_004039 [Mortierella alpina]
MESTARRATSTTRRATATDRSVASTTTVRRTNTAGRATTVHTASTSVASPTASSEPQPGGLSGGAIGGIAAGVVVVLAVLAGVLFYKRRKRYGSTKKDGSQDEPMYMHASNYSRKKGPPDNGISGPLALAPETDVGAGPSPFPPPHSRPEQEPRHAGPRHAGGNEHSGMYGRDGQDDHLSSNRGHGGNNTPLNERQPFQDDYYDDNLVHDYYSSPPEPHVGARRTPAEARDMPQGNITPAPEYYLGKEDIDPLRDLRGLDSPEAYLRDKKSPPMPSSLAQVEQRVEPHPSLDSPRSSFSSDASSEYLTLEQAQKAHQKKMMGHKESIGSHQMLMDKHYQGQKPQGQLLSPTTPSFAPDHASMAISDSTMSMMPSLPPNSSPMSFSPQHSNSGMHSRQGSGSRTQASYPSTPILSGGKGIPGGGRGHQRAGHDDPYAESAYSEDFTDHRSLISSSPYQPPYSGGGHPPPPGRAYSPYSKSPHSPHGPGFQQGGGGYRNNGPGYPGSPPFNGYSTRPQQPTRGPGGGDGGYGPPQGRHGPGYGPPGPGRGGPHHYSPSHNGYHPVMEGNPGSGSYMPYDQQLQQPRDPGYNQTSYSRAY